MWLVTVRTANPNTGRVREHRESILSDPPLGLFDHDRFDWDILFAFLDRGIGLRVDIHYRPGIKRIEQEDNLHYLTIDGIPVGRAYEDRGDAWNQVLPARAWQATKIWNLTGEWPVVPEMEYESV